MSIENKLDELDLTARELASLIRRKQVSPVEVVAATLRRIEAKAELNAFITVTGDLALDAARRAEKAVMAGEALSPLHGVPYSVKDLTLTAGVRTTMGSAIYENFVPNEDAVPVARAKAAGAILIGKTTTPEFGAKQAAQAPIFGRTLNPIHPGYTPGASSSGAAVAVAAGLGPIALGTDGGGSIRIPASCCGIIGLKPTLGAVANLQPADLFSVNSYVGPMARDVADAALLYHAIKGPHFLDPYG
ncbi:MAG: amidase, partial [Polaromonas sp.]